MGLLYAKDGKIYCNDYCEISIPMEYFENNLAQNAGAYIESFGITFIRTFPGGNEGPFQMLNLPVIVNFMVYEFRQETISIQNRSIDVITLQYMKDAYIIHQSITKGREVAEAFLAWTLNGKLPKTLKYPDTINLWWRNLEISGVTFKVPSKMYEMILATTYRNPHNPKERYGQLYGRQNNPNGLDYATGNVRSVVRNLSTFSGMVFEDIGTMISNGINNALDGIEEPVSPLEKIIHY